MTLSTTTQDMELAIVALGLRKVSLVPVSKSRWDPRNGDAGWYETILDGRAVGLRSRMVRDKTATAQALVLNLSVACPGFIVLGFVVLGSWRWGRGVGVVA